MVCSYACCPFSSISTSTVPICKILKRLIISNSPFKGVNLLVINWFELTFNFCDYWPLLHLLQNIRCYLAILNIVNPGMLIHICIRYCTLLPFSAFKLANHMSRGGGKEKNLWAEKKFQSSNAQPFLFPPLFLAGKQSSEIIWPSNFESLASAGNLWDHFGVLFSVFRTYCTSE